jgi:ABC-2 type transport system ATP-binding protein
MEVPMSNANNPAIAVRGLQKRFGDLEALAGIDFEVAPATVFGLLGPNGAGKTTAVRILTTILEPDGGTAEVLGFDVVRDPERVRLRIGLAGQAATVDPNLTGRENLRLVGRLSQRPRPWIEQRAAELLENFDLTQAADRPIRTYSGGMRRRLDVAAALVGRPPVLFLDEPTTGLDLPSRNTLWDTIRDLVAEGTTVLLTTQYLEEADRLAEQIAVVDLGRVIAEGTPARLKAQLGSTVIEFAMSDEMDAERAVGALSRQRAEAEREGSHDPRADHGGAEVPHGDAADAGRRGAVPVVADRPRTQSRRRVPSPDRPPRGARGRGGIRATRPRRRCGMSQAAVAIPIPAERQGWSRFTGFVADSVAMLTRNIITLRRVPQLLVFSTIQPVIFVLLFVYVFGGAVGNATGLPYIDFLVPGIFVQMSVFGAMGTAIGLASDVKSGLLERFHALPMARSAVLAGRTSADVVRNVFVILLVSGVALLIGFRVQTNVFGYVGGIALVLLFGYALSWVFAGVGLAVKDPETAAGGRVPDHGAARVRLDGVRAGEPDGPVAPAVRRAPARVRGRLGRSSAHARHAEQRLRPPGIAVDRRDHRRGRAAGRSTVPTGHLTVSSWQLGRGTR